MNRSLVILLVAVFLLLPLGTDSAGEKNAAKTCKVDRLIGQLDHARFEVRETAEQKLLELSGNAADQLRNAADARSPEVRYRIRRVLDQLERDHLVGYWQLIRWESGGESKTGRENIIHVRREVWSAKKWRFDYRTNPLTVPKQLDWQFGNRTQHAIYKIEDGKLILCFSELNDPRRPTEFKTRRGDGFSLHVRKRVSSPK